MRKGGVRTDKDEETEGLVRKRENVRLMLSRCGSGFVFMYLTMKTSTKNKNKLKIRCGIGGVRLKICQVE